jgi:hypothetical protein
MIVRTTLRSVAAIAALAVATAVPVLAQSAMSSGMGDVHVFALAAQNGSNEIGTVTLQPMGEKTMVTVALANPTNASQPVHVHAGTCDKLDPKPAYPLTTLKNGYSVTTVDAPASKLMNGNFAVNAHDSTTNLAKYVACGNLVAK